MISVQPLLYRCFPVCHPTLDAVLSLLRQRRKVTNKKYVVTSHYHYLSVYGYTVLFVGPFPLFPFLIRIR